MLSASDAAKYIKPTSSKPIAYGTAGFRARAETLESTFYRMGMLAVLRSRARGGLASGLMVTASHNPEPDNGIKLVDTDGGMLHQSWEGFATRLANADEGELPAVLAAVAAETATAEAAGGVVVIGRDTRPHSEGLANIAPGGQFRCVRPARAAGEGAAGSAPLLARVLQFYRHRWSSVCRYRRAA